MAVRVTRLCRRSVLPTLCQKDGLSSSCRDCDRDDVLIWSSNGDIDAGKGAKTALLAPPPRVIFDATSGTFTTEFTGEATGSGIGTLITGTNQEPGDVSLIAPRGRRRCRHPRVEQSRDRRAGSPRHRQYPGERRVDRCTDQQDRHGCADIGLHAAQLTTPPAQVFPARGPSSHLDLSMTGMSAAIGRRTINCSMFPRKRAGISLVVKS